MSSNTLAPLLSRKLKKVLETRTDSPDVVESLRSLSEFYTENNANSRKNLKTTLERRGLDINEQFLRASEAAQIALDAVESEISGLAECCDRISLALGSCRESTGDMVVATERLRAELDSTTRRQELVASFLHDYQLTTQEIASLREDDLDEGFFKALARVQEIHSNCKILLRTHHQRAGLELMDMMAVYQEGAYERLCRWVQSECRALALGDSSASDSPEVPPLLRTAAQWLSGRPVLVKYCAEEVAATRHNALFRRFITALTRGGPGGTPRPIEVHAHDPLRYVGDMLAWLHQALASERDLALQLFGPPQSMDGEAQAENGGSAVALWSVLDRVFEGVCRPFRVRVEQVLSGQAHPQPVVLCQMALLLGFYRHTLGSLLGPSASLSATLRELEQSAQGAFQGALQQRAERLLRFPLQVPPDLSPPPVLADSLALALELAEVHVSAMLADGMERPQLVPVLEAIISPLMSACQRAAEGLTGVGGPPGGPGAGLGGKKGPLKGKGVGGPEAQFAQHLFLVNCWSSVGQSLEGIPGAQDFCARLAGEIEGHLGALVKTQVDKILIKCQLAEKLEAMSKPRPAGSLPLAEDPELSPAAVSESLRQLFAELAGGEGAMSAFEKVQSPRLRSTCVSSVLSGLCEAYGTVYRSVMAEGSGYPEPQAMLRHTPLQMRTILGI